MKTLKTLTLASLLVALPVLANAAATIPSLPVVTKAVNPEVPVDFRGVKGEVQVLFRITAEGTVQDLKVEGASHQELAESVVNAVRLWKFEPVVDAEGNTKTPLVRLPVRFN